MTKSTKAKKRKKPKRRYLDRKLNLKGRRDYIETFYVDGIKDSDGNYALRPLNEEEKDWLNQYYKEVVNADRRDSEFYTDDEEWKKIYGENNARNRDLYNQAKKTGKLVKINYKDYDDITIKKLQGLDTEHIIIHYRDLDKKKED